MAALDSKVNVYKLDAQIQYYVVTWSEDPIHWVTESRIHKLLQRYLANTRQSFIYVSENLKCINSVVLALQKYWRFVHVIGIEDTNPSPIPTHKSQVLRRTLSPRWSTARLHVTVLVGLLTQCSKGLRQGGHLKVIFNDDDVCGIQEKKTEGHQMATVDPSVLLQSQIRGTNVK
jgi:hypothetical protein